MAANPKPRLTPEQYLEIERKAEMKSEYISGEMFAMAGATRAHNLIVANVIGELRNILRQRPCESYPSDMRVKSPATASYTYPDVVVVCDKPVFEDGREDTLLNPGLLVEVLSPSTEAYDRGEKFAHYRHIESLTDYLLISSDKPLLEHYARQADGRWLLSEAVGLKSALSLDNLSITLRLADVYERVDFANVEKYS